MVDLTAATAFFEHHAEQTTALRRDIHRHPELAFQERRTAAVVAERLLAYGVDKVETGIGGPGVVGVIRGAGDGPGVGLRADMDALPIQEANTFAHRSRRDGVMHACGHDGHTAMLLAAAQYLAANRAFAGTVYAIFQPAEEGEGGGRAMVEDGLFARFPMAAVYGLHNWPGLPEGVFAARVGAQMAAFDLFDIAVSGQAAHAAMPHHGADVLVAASALTLHLQTIVARAVDPLAAAVVSVTQIHGGEARNILPPRALLRGCTRHFTPAVQARMRERMDAICQGVAQAHGVEVKLTYEPRYPATVNSRDETLVARRAAALVAGPDRVFEDEAPSMGSEDFAFMLQARPGCYAWLGAGPRDNGKSLHCERYDFNDNLLPIGAAYWVAVAAEGLAAAGRT